MTKDKKIEFIQKSEKIHGIKYKYSDINYKNLTTKIKIFCNKCNLYFYQRPSDHLSGCGCPNCRQIRTSATKIQKHNKIFFEKAPIIHNDLYDYSLAEYTGSKNKIKIICKRCNRVFLQTPGGHLQGKGCKFCNNSYTQEDFLKKAHLIHGNNYDYSQVEYVHSHSLVKIKCNYCNNIFEQKPVQHLFGYGCNCNKGGYSKSDFEKVCKRNKKSSPKLYIIECFDSEERFIKIGITSHTVKYRFRHKKDLPYSYKIIKEISGLPNYIYDLEKEFHLKLKEYNYIPKKSFCGRTECYFLNVKEFI